MSEHQTVSGFEMENVSRYAALAVGSFAITALVAILMNGAVAVLAGLGATTAFGTRMTRISLRNFVRSYGLVVMAATLAALLVTSQLKPGVFALLLVIHAMVSYFVRTLKNMGRLGIELVMLITVLGSFAYGPKTGAILGAVALLMDYVFSARFSYFAPITMTAYALVGLLAANFTSFGITTVGIAATIIYNLVTSLIIIIFARGNPEKCLIFGLSDTVFNLALFTAVAPWLLSVVR